MGVDIGPKIGIEGEAQFRKELQQINQGLKTLGSEMNAVTSEFLGNENSVEALTAKDDVLSRTIYTLNEKLQAQQRMLAESASAYGEADSRTQRWQQAVNETTTALNKAEHQLKQNTEAIDNFSEAEDEAGEESGSLQDALGELGISLQALTVAGVVGLAIAGLKELTEWISDAAKESMEYADTILTLSTNYGIATDTLQEYQYMAELTDTSLDTITGSISRLTRNMDKARDGTGDAAEAFARLNINVTESDGQLRDSEEVFNELIDRLGMMTNETERDAIAQTLLGKSAMDLNSLIAVGSDGIAAYAEEARAMGYVLSEDDLEAIGAVDDSFQRLDKMMEAAKNRMMVEMAPALLDLAQQLLDVAMQVDWEEFGRAASMVIKDLTPVVTSLARAIAGLAEAFAHLLDAFNNFQGKAPAMRNDGTLRVSGYASGGVFEPNDPRLVMVGDNHTEREVIAPRSEIISAVQEAMGGGNMTPQRTGSMRPLVINIDGQQVAYAMIDPLEDRTALRGLVI